MKDFEVQYKAPEASELPHRVNHFVQHILVGDICDGAAVMICEPCSGIDIDIFHDIEGQAVGFVDLGIAGVLLVGNCAVLGGGYHGIPQPLSYRGEV